MIARQGLATQCQWGGKSTATYRQTLRPPADTAHCGDRRRKPSHRGRKWSGKNQLKGTSSRADRVYVSLGTAGTYHGYGPVYRNIPW